MRKLTLALGVVVVALAGCGGGDSGDTNTGVGNTGAATTDIPRTGTISPATTEHETETDDD